MGNKRENEIPQVIKSKGLTFTGACDGTCKELSVAGIRCGLARVVPCERAYLINGNGTFGFFPWILKAVSRLQ